MNPKNNPYDLDEVMELVRKNPGINRDRVMMALGATCIDNKERSKMQRAQNKLGRKMFIQKRGCKCHFYTNEYAADHNIPARVSAKQPKKTTKTQPSLGDISDFESINRMHEINRLMPVVG